MPKSKRPEASLVFSFAEHIAGLTQLAEAVAAPLEHLNRPWREQQERISAMFEEIGPQMEDSYPRLESASDRLADLGWTIPMQITLRALVS